ncbi:hypothetical protein LEMLEM_LOCUS11069, partial [Lemmus lemmus]
MYLCHPPFTRRMPPCIDNTHSASPVSISRSLLISQSHLQVNAASFSSVLVVWDVCRTEWDNKG